MFLLFDNDNMNMLVDYIQETFEFYGHVVLNFAVEPRKSSKWRNLEPGWILIKIFKQKKGW